jgi:hypothetical protein
MNPMALFVLFFLFCSLFLPVSSAEIAVSGVSSLAMDTNCTSPFTDNMEILAHFFGTEEQKAPNVSISTTSKDEAYFVHPWFGDPDITSYRTVFSSFFSLRTSRSLSWRNQGRSAMLVCPGGLGLANEYRRICKLRYRFINATWKRLHGKRFRVDRRKNYLFDASLGYPGEGPSSLDHMVSKPQAKLPEASRLSAMQLGKQESICEQEISTKDKLSRLTQLRELTSPSLFIIFLQWSCCLGAVDVNNAYRLYSETLRYNSLSQHDRKNEALYSLSTFWRKDLNDFGQLVLDGWPVCVECYAGLYNHSDRSWARLLASVRAGDVTWEHGNTGNLGNFTASGWDTRVWMRNFFFTLGDFQPDNGQVHLPPMDKKDVHAELSKDLETPLSESAFLRVWREEFPEVRIPAEQRLNKCEECKLFHESIMATKDIEIRKDFKNRRHEHIAAVKAERLVYHQWRGRAREEPLKYLSIIIGLNYYLGELGFVFGFVIACLF